MSGSGAYPMSGEDWRDIFCGRTRELDVLVDAFRRVRNGQGPCLVAVLGDRGMGKTRLVQEFYRRLASDEFDPQHYWPDAALITGANVDVAPRLTMPAVEAHYRSFPLGKRTMPFLWWGFRLHESGQRNAASNGMAAHRETLEFHLAERKLRKEMERVSPNSKDNWLEVGKKFAGMVPGVDAALNLVELSLLLRKMAHARREQETLQGQAVLDPVALGVVRSEDILEATLAELGEMMGGEHLPVIVYCDDAQFAGYRDDAGSFRLLAELWKRACAANWPLLLVMTHWAVDWDVDEQSGCKECCAVLFHAAAEDARVRIDLSRESDLVAMIQAGLPGLPVQDAGLLLEKSDGNPQFLVELIQHVAKKPAWREQGSGALKPHARREIESMKSNLVGLIIERLESEGTPEAIRQLAALSSVQGMEFLCDLSVSTGDALGLSGLDSMASVMQSPHRLVMGVNASGGGVASFVQRAYREAAKELLSGHVDTEETVKQVLLEMTIGMVEDADAMEAMPVRDRMAARGVLIDLAEHHAQAAIRHRAGSALLAQIRQTIGQGDYAMASAVATRFETGVLEGRFTLQAYPMGDLRPGVQALLAWEGPSRAEPLCALMLDAARESHGAVAQADHGLAMILELMGDIHLGKVDTTRAEACFREYLECARHIVQVDEGPGSHAMLWSALVRLANVRMAVHGFCTFNAQGQKAIAEAMFAEGVEREPLMDMAAHNAHEAEVALAEAEPLVVEALQLARHLADETQRMSPLVADTLNALADVRLAQGAYTEAMTCRRESLEIRRVLVNSDTAEGRAALASTLLHTAALAKRTDRQWEESLVLEARDISSRLAKAVPTLPVRRTLASALEALAELRCESEPSQAEDLYSEALVLRRELNAKAGSQSEHQALLDAIGKMRDLQAKLHHHETVTALEEEARGLVQSGVTRFFPHESQVLLIDALEAQAVREAGNGHPEVALRTCVDLVGMRRSRILVDSASRLRDTWALARALELSGDLHMTILGKDPASLEQLTHAADCYLETLACISGLDPEPFLIEAEATILVKVAAVHVAMDDLGTLVGHADVLVSAIDRIGPNGISADARRNLLIVLQQLGHLLDGQGSVEKALRCRIAGLGCSRAQAKAFGEVAFQQDLFRWLLLVAPASADLGHPDAVNYFEEALSLLDRLQEPAKEPTMLRTSLLLMLASLHQHNGDGAAALEYVQQATLAGDELAGILQDAEQREALAEQFAEVGRTFEEARQGDAAACVLIAERLRAHYLA